VAYLRALTDAGLSVDEALARLEFRFAVTAEQFPSIAKLRAARRIWARWMRDVYGARTDKAQWLRFHTQTAGVSLTAQQPYNNVVRTALQAIAAVLGGTNSLHTNSLDEALALPTEAAATLALRTQQIIAFESGAADVIDPFGGSYFVEKLTDDIEREALDYFRVIDGMGGMVEAIEQGFPQKEISESAYQFQRSVESRDKLIVGVNAFAHDRERPIGTLYIDAGAERAQLARLDDVRRRRDAAAVTAALTRLKQAAVSVENTMPPMLEAVRAYATIGEMCDALRDVWGEYVERPII
jgi:methylmalonyl-CoA mutase N-terminal domain/subunit